MVGKFHGSARICEPTYVSLPKSWQKDERLQDPKHTSECVDLLTRKAHSKTGKTTTPSYVFVPSVPVDIPSVCFEFGAEEIFFESSARPHFDRSGDAFRGVLIEDSIITDGRATSFCEQECMDAANRKEVPTVGSANHQLSECKPCSFFWKPAGCTNGVNCNYCHLCDNAEKLRRKKEKKALSKAIFKAKSNFQRAPMSATTTAPSTRSASSSGSEDETVCARRGFRAVGGINIVEFDAECPSAIARHDSDDDAPIRRGNKFPALYGKQMSNAYGAKLLVRNTLPEFGEDLMFLQMRRVEPASSGLVVARGAMLPPTAPAVVELASMPSPKSKGRQIPTVGSAKHHLGSCKPCVFVWTPAGCTNGVSCPYCHLCDAKEKRRRQKQKKAFLKVHVGIAQ